MSLANDFNDKQIDYILILYAHCARVVLYFKIISICFSLCRIPEYGAVLRFAGERVQIFRSFYARTF